ncbi:long-chain-acyl-CoA synthetase [Candidatus Viadribacter manganicus]|uniref:Long-chain acyl-CoA synthetase n=1 Tax=Candidatus Viadribacter manganicus TaxID=1759059 RepID=A0A1B1AIV0_9PROT|nr:long-chain-acyl-CoA synthetase [Candidatus Viadribacter manganicus]ANP46481.1 long-chain acyl-CoA synthetase [Candidatus Viadribacter manganicus]
MDPLQGIAREIRFLDGLARTLWSVRKIDPDSDFLVCDDFEEAVDTFADHTALVFEGERYTYRQLDALANRFAAWADAQGLKAGDNVALLLPNRAEYVPAWVGLTKLGIAAALINNNLTGAALAHCLSISNASHVITDNEGLAATETIRAGLPRVLSYWIIDAEFPTANDRHALDLKSPKLAPERPLRSRRTGLKARDVALYIYTSGTTGMPKAAKITHMRAQLYMRSFAGATKANAEDKIYCVLPLYHATGGLCGVGSALLRGGTLVLRRKFSATHFWGDVIENECTMFVYIGELCRYLVNQDPSPDDRRHQLRLAFGNGLRPEVWEEFQARFNVPRVMEFYGSTEGNVSMFNFDGQPGAIGRVPPYLQRNFAVRLVKFDVETEMPVRGEDGLCQLCGPDEPGEAVGLIKDDARHNYTGYADKAASERKILRDVLEKGDAWFRTGDLMRQDKDGYFYFVDRIGDTFRWKGENVSTTEVAEVISRYPGVDEASVYGVKIDRIDGRAGMAAITPSEEFKIEGLRDYLTRELPSYARPLFIRIAPAIETTGTFKYRKVDLVRDGFDPAKIEQAVYFAQPDEQRYISLTPALYVHIQSGAFKL